MCRVVAYLGEPLPLSTLLYDSDSSLVHQAYDPDLYAWLNLGGAGVAAWDSGSQDPGQPLCYRSTKLPMYDRTLVSVSRKMVADCLLGHVRGTDYFKEGIQLVAEPNVHPFLHDGAPVALAHNGGLDRFSEMKLDLLPHIDPAIATRIEGTTDSEWIYAVLLTQLDKVGRDSLTIDDIADGVAETFRVIRKVRNERGITIASAANLFVSDGTNLVVTRFMFDFGWYEGAIREDQLAYHSLWYTIGDSYGLHDGEWRMDTATDEPTSILIASEPLTKDYSTWVEVPEYTMIMATKVDGRVSVHARDLDA